MTLQLKDFVPEESYLKVLLYGDSWTWKTVFWAKAKNSLILCVENWLAWIDKVIKDLSFKMCEINSFNQLREAYELLANWTWKFDTIVIDSISKMDNFLQAEIRWRKETMTQQERWIFGRRMQWLIDAFMKLPCNIIIIAEEDSEKDSDSTIKIYPKVSGQTWKRLSYNFDIVWHTYKVLNDKNEVEFKINVEYDPLAVTKCRWWFITNNTPNDFNEWLKLSKWSIAWVKKTTSNAQTFNWNNFETLFKKFEFNESVKDNVKATYDALEDLKWNELKTKWESIKLDIDNAPEWYFDDDTKSKYKDFIDFIIQINQWE